MVIKFLDIDVKGHAAFDIATWCLGPIFFVRRVPGLRGLDTLGLGLHLGPITIGIHFWHWRGNR